MGSKIRTVAGIATVAQITSMMRRCKNAKIDQMNVKDKNPRQMRPGGERSELRWRKEEQV